MVFKCYAQTKHKLSCYTKYSFSINQHDSITVGTITIEAQDGLFEINKDYDINITTIQEVL
jgi:hypothetical protein